MEYTRSIKVYVFIYVVANNVVKMKIVVHSLQ